MYLKHSTNLLFVNNQALSVGGAVYTDLTLELPGLTLPCFFQVLTEGQQEGLVMSTISVEFVNNTAGVAGNSLYGGYIDGSKGLDTGRITGFYITTHEIPQRYLLIRVGVCFCSLTSLEPKCQTKPLKSPSIQGSCFIS